MPTLYVVATPIGNLEDISLRALRTLREVKLIAAEDTRKTRRLLGAYDIKTPVTSYYEQNKRSKLGYIMGQLEEGDIAIVSEAGVPCISDPGYELIVAASRQGIPVVPIPGASAVTAALSVSGLATDRFTYIGFLPRKSGENTRQAEGQRKGHHCRPGSTASAEAGAGRYSACSRRQAGSHLPPAYQDARGSFPGNSNTGSGILHRTQG